MPNKNFGKLYIRKRNLSQWLTGYIFLIPFLLAFLQEFLNLPSIVRYTVDLAWILVFVLLFFKKHLLLEKKITPLITIIALFFATASLVYLFRYESIFYYLWGIRNNFRFYIAFIAFAVLLDEKDIKSCFKLVDVLFWVNVAVSFFQYFILHYEQDRLGGIFGVEKGCNAYSLIFFGIVLSKSLLSFMNGEEKTITCLLKCSIALFISALAELKFFFIIFVIILIMSTIFTKFSFRKFVVLFISAFLISFSSTILTSLFGENSNLSLERILELVTATSYSTAEDLGRFTAIPTLSNTILTHPIEQIFGLGIGNCDTSSFAICNTPFYQSYSYLHYNWFSSAFLFLETGYVGLITYLIFFVICFILAIKQLKNKNSNPLYCQIGMIFAVLCVILTFYNSSLRMEVGYLAYFALALPFINKDNFNKSTITQ